MKSEIKKMAIPTVEAKVVIAVSMVTAAAIPIITFLALFTDNPEFISLSEAHPPIILEIPSARKGIQKRSPICSKETPRSSLRYFGIQNMIK